MKREDSEIIDLVSKKYKYVEKWKSIPLLYFNNFHKVFSKYYDILQSTSEIGDKNYVKNMKSIKKGFLEAPVDKFIFCSNLKDQSLLMKVKIDKDSNTAFLESSGTVEDDGDVSIVRIMKIKLELYGDDFHTELINYYDFDGHSSDNLEKVMAYITTMISCVFNKLSQIAETNLYPIEKTVNNFKRKFKYGSKKKIGKQRTIVYLNKLPVKYIGSKKLGGHHASPCYHQRIGHMHTMRHEKFKDHPDYMKPIWRKPVWVGVRETIVDGVTYKVL